jgi:Zonular occludens toxin (Zot).
MSNHFIVRKNLKASLSLKNLIDTLKYKSKFKKENPHYFDPDGLLVFCGFQGSGKTLSAVQYVKNLMEAYPRCILCTNTDIKGIDENRVCEYNGLDSLKTVKNDMYGVIFLIDEMHLEFNSLESKNTPIEVFVEISQQRKQRVHIVGTSQRYTRIAKSFREQINYIIDCNNYFNVLQNNKLILGESVIEKSGEVTAKVNKRIFFFHSPAMYESYNTYAKMKRYNKEWQGHKVGGVVYG